MHEIYGSSQHKEDKKKPSKIKSRRTWPPVPALCFFGQNEEVGDAGPVIQQQAPVAGFVVVS
jgi:hypothetical protein